MIQFLLTALIALPAQAHPLDPAKLWYHCSLTAAEGQWAIQNYPLSLDLFYGKTLEKDSLGFAIHWEGSIAMNFRDGRVRLSPADYTEPSQDTPFHGTFPEIDLDAKSSDPAFEFVDRCDPKTGGHIAYELTYTEGKGTYDCQIVEPVHFPGH
jgi:hypothetical protein